MKMDQGRGVNGSLHFFYITQQVKSVQSAFTHLLATSGPRGTFSRLSTTGARIDAFQ